MLQALLIASIVFCFFPPTFPVGAMGLIAWGLMAWLGRAVDEADVSSGAGCGGTMAMIVFVGLGALAMVAVFGAMLEGRL